MIIQEQFEKSVVVLHSAFAVLLFYRDFFTPKSGDDPHVLERVATAKFPEHAEHSSRNSPHASIADTLKVYNAVK